MRKFYKRTLCILFVITIVISTLSSCNQNKNNDAQIDENDYYDLPYSEVAGSISICGNPISEYTIVIPASCDLYTKYAAQNLRDYLIANANIELEIVTDETSAGDKELLVGKTNRVGSITASQTTLGTYEYIIMQDKSSVVLYGEGYMVGAAAGDLMNKRALGAWKGIDVDITNIPTKPVVQTFTFEKANNAILLIGDGMGHNHINMTLRSGLDRFSARDMQNAGEIVTKSQSVINNEIPYTDSAAAGTALATGFKTINEYLGVDPQNTPLVSLRELAHSVGAKTAILSTAAISDATPAAFLVHCSDRWQGTAILNEINQVLNDGGVDYAFGSISDDLVDVSAPILHSISANGSQFFSMIEEGYIDKYAHNNDTKGILHTVKRFNELISYCMEFVLFHPDTVLIVTADHETGGITEVPVSDTTKFIYTSMQHTNVNVPIYAMGYGTEYFNNIARDNTRVPHFIAKLYGVDNFGDPRYPI